MRNLNLLQEAFLLIPLIRIVFNNSFQYFFFSNLKFRLLFKNPILLHIQFFTLPLFNMVIIDYFQKFSFYKQTLDYFKDIFCFYFEYILLLEIF